MWTGGQEWKPFEPDPFSNCQRIIDRAIADTVSALICHGVFDRHPNVRIACIENGAFWVDGLIKTFDHVYGQMPQSFKQHPTEVFKRHFFVAPFNEDSTPELVEQICGCSRQDFLKVAAALCENSGRELTSSIVYAVGWTQHTVGVQNVRAASIIQLLLGNIGRPGGGILALRGHANIQGSTDIPTLYNILPGYIPVPHPQSHPTLDKFVELNGPDTGVWGNLRPYIVSLLKAWWGDAATQENDFCFQYLPRINGDHSHYAMMLKMLDGGVKGMLCVGQNPTVGSANSKLMRLALA